MPWYLWYRFEKLFIHTDHPFQGMSQFFALFPGLLGNYLRRAFYYLALPKSSLDCNICFGTILSSENAQIGKRVYIGTNCTIGDVNIGNDVLLGSNVDIMNGSKQHYIDNIDIPIREQGGEYPKVTIGEDTWIGNGATVLCNVGKKCVIGARTLVIKPIDDFSIAVGVPARIVKKRK
jgi:acetyltransferase-like isoleucine patch superfamily enzyme